MSGLTLTRLIVNRNPLTAVIVLSPESNAQLLTEALNAGASDYITKPFELSNVVQAVERALKRYLPEAVA
jgi:FixJ family two-component response regulator